MISIGGGAPQKPVASAILDSITATSLPSVQEVPKSEEEVVLYISAARSSSYKRKWRNSFTTITIHKRTIITNQRI